MKYATWFIGSEPIEVDSKSGIIEAKTIAINSGFRGILESGMYGTRTGKLWEVDHSLKLTILNGSLFKHAARNGKMRVSVGIIKSILSFSAR